MYSPRSKTWSPDLFRRRLFWKIYLTLLVSLMVATMLMSGLWWLLGETPHERWSTFRAHLAERLEAAPAGSAEIAQSVQRLGDEIGSDISLYGKDGALVTARGTPITYPSRIGDPDHRPHFFVRVDLPDGRTILVRAVPPQGERIRGIIMTAVVVAAGVALGAFPLTARLTRRLERLRGSMARWGDGDLSARVDDRGDDEVASVGRTFNSAAERINLLLAAHKALLANASHELRSPLARLRIAIDLWQQEPDANTRDEIVRNLAEIDQLVDEILLSSRLDHPSSKIGRVELVDVLGLAAEEATRIGASVEGAPAEVEGSEILLRRLLRNLLENAVHHGRFPVQVEVATEGDLIRLTVSDAGEGIPDTERERVFEPFYRPAGRSESAGGWGLGLSLVRQIATRHGGSVVCESQSGRGTSFIVTLPAAADGAWGGPDSASRRSGKPPAAPLAPKRESVTL